MLGYLARRLGAYAVMTFVATSIAYLAAVSFLRPDLRLLAATPRPAPEVVQARLADFGLDPTASAWERYGHWLHGVVTAWDWGNSPGGTPVSAEFVERALVSGRLMLLATLLQIVLGVALGVFCAVRHHRPSDRVITTASFVIACLPAPVAFLWVQMAGIFTNAYASHYLGQRLVYVSGMGSPVPPEGFWAGLGDQAAHLVLPTIALTLLGYGGYHLLQRSVLLDDVDSDYVRTARAKGLTRAQAIRRHALRTSFVPVAQNIAFALPAVFAGAFVVEAVFAWEGLGSYTLDALTRTQDVNAVVASMAFGCVLFAVGAIAADVVIEIIDPRARGVR